MNRHLRLWAALSFFSLLFVAHAASSQSWVPSRSGSGGAGSTTVIAGGGAQQGIPSGNTYSPGTFGTGIAWSSLHAVSANTVYIPSTSAKATNLWYIPNAACTTGSTEPAWCSAYGCTVPVDGSCTWTAKGTTQPIPGVWATAFDFDWTQGVSTSFSTDGAFTFGGTTWTKTNSVNEVVHTSAGGGTGLNFQPALNTNDAAATRNAPIIAVPLQTIVPGVTWTMPLRILVWEAAGNQTSSNAGYLMFGIDGGDTHRPCIALDYGNSGGSTQIFSVAQGDSSSHSPTQFVAINYTSNNADFSGARMLELEFPNGFAGFLWNIYVASAPTAGVWPSQSTFNPFAIQASGAYTGGWINTVINMWFMPTAEEAPTTLANMELYLTGINTNAVTGGTNITINRVRVDYKPNY